jgi:hypothetical protein
MLLTQEPTSFVFMVVTQEPTIRKFHMLLHIFHMLLHMYTCILHVATLVFQILEIFLVKRTSSIKAIV